MKSLDEINRLIAATEAELAGLESRQSRLPPRPNFIAVSQ